MIVDPSPPPAPPPTAAPAEQPLPESAEKISSSNDLIGDATSWPSLSESTRLSPKSSPAPATDPPIATSQAPAISNSPHNHLHPDTDTTLNRNPSFPQNLNQQRSSGRGRFGRGGSSRGGFIRHPVPPQQLPLPPPLPPVFYGGFEGPIRGPFFYGNGLTYQHLTDHQFLHPSSFQRSGARSRGDGVHHYNHANYRGLDWNTAPQGFHPRDVRFPQPGLPMRYPMPPHPLVPLPFMHGPIIPPEPLLGMPLYGGSHSLIPPPSPPPPHPVSLQTKLLNQINYYFSEENLVKDMYLRSVMDAGGWVPVSLIADFKKVRDLTQDIHLVRESLEASAVVEVQGDKMRRRNDWRRWIPTSLVREEPTTELTSAIRYFQNARLEEVHADRSSSSATNACRSPREVLT